MDTVSGIISIQKAHVSEKFTNMQAITCKLYHAKATTFFTRRNAMIDGIASKGPFDSKQRPV